MALSQISDPYSTPWQQWVDTLVGFNLSLRATLSPDEPWQVVADRLTESEQSAPRPESFTDWREWAAALKQAYPD